MAIVICRECKKEISSKAKSCVHCGAPTGRGGAGGVGGLIAVLALGVVGWWALEMMGGLVAVDERPRPRTIVEAEWKPEWKYANQVDDASGKPIQTARTESVERVDLGFPYQGYQRAELALRRHPRWGAAAWFAVKKGQITCDFRDCVLTVRFDDGPPQRWSGGKADDGSTTHVFFSDWGRFEAAVKRASRVIVAVTFYQRGEHTFTFDVRGLQWPPAPSQPGKK